VLLTHVFRYQVAGGLAGFGYSFVMTLVLLALMQITSIWIPSLELRAHGRQNEPVRLDVDELGDIEAVRHRLLSPTNEIFHFPNSFSAYFLKYRINCNYHRVRDSRERERSDSTEENGLDSATSNEIENGRS
jgi:hypothetical protein